ncbi:MarR family winged helix-turn-helix transcriptional regulator [Pseudarthrobacter sp. NPDC058329]|uniref:MarR family winged helix-turn-helix transcriptional regulator n=1 Tax=Pseudarthrobacter sp. NPDC058329 TaxID=3346448 RepID=UPI0036DE1C31
MKEIESSAVAALVRLVGYWTSDDFQGVLARRAGVDTESRDVPALFMLARLGPVRPSVCARALNVSAGNVSRMVDRLAARGYARRIADPYDARASLVSLTELGTNAAERLNREGERLFTDLLSAWPPGESMMFSAMLVRFADEVAKQEH